MHLLFDKCTARSKLWTRCPRDGTDIYIPIDRLFYLRKEMPSKYFLLRIRSERFCHLLSLLTHARPSVLSNTISLWSLICDCHNCSHSRRWGSRVARKRSQGEWGGSMGMVDCCNCTERERYTTTAMYTQQTISTHGMFYPHVVSKPLKSFESSIAGRTVRPKHGEAKRKGDHGLWIHTLGIKML